MRTVPLCHLDGGRLRSWSIFRRRHPGSNPSRFPGSAPRASSVDKTRVRTLSPGSAGFVEIQAQPVAKRICHLRVPHMSFAESTFGGRSGERSRIWSKSALPSSPNTPFPPVRKICPKTPCLFPGKPDTLLVPTSMGPGRGGRQSTRAAPGRNHRKATLAKGDTFGTDDGTHRGHPAPNRSGRLVRGPPENRTPSAPTLGGAEPGEASDARRTLGGTASPPRVGTGCA